MKKYFTLGLGLLGLALGTAVVVSLGAGRIAHAISQIGFIGIVYVVSWQLAVFVLLGIAWRTVCPGAPIWATIWARLVREGGENCLPFSEVGGLVFGARALMLCGVDFVRAAVSSIIDVITEGIGLGPFLLFGVAMVLIHHPHSSLLLPVGLGVGLLFVGGGAVFVLRKQLLSLFRKGAAWMLKRWVKDAPQRAEELQRTFEGLFHEPWRVTGASLLHVLCWFGGGGNVWIAYHLLGAKPSFLDAFAIESILSAVLAFGFIVPGGLGVQELTYIGVGRLFGMPAHLSLALSLIRRARDILIGAPALLIWQALEARKLRGARKSA